MADEDYATYDAVVDKDAEIQAPEQPIYRMIGESKLPVSKHRGKIWQSRRKQSVSATQPYRRAWEEAIRYWENDQTPNRTSTGSVDSSTSAIGTRKLRETENIVFANICALVPMLYMKNPTAEFTAGKEEDQQLSALLEKLVNRLAGQMAAPGINLKPKARRALVMSLLCNLSWFEVGYIKRESSSETALGELMNLTKEFEEAKDKKTLLEVEGKLLALESKVDMLAPSGPWVKVRKPWEVHIDTNANEIDLSDANWCIVDDMMPTALLNALYAEKSEDGKYRSVYAPTHIIKDTDRTLSEDNLTGDNFVLFSKQGAWKDLGFESENAYRAAQCTRVCYVWDKATRRCELYTENDWCYPIWVWDDPYQLDTFFPLVPLTMHTSPFRPYSKGEVSYYLDQQDGLNVINNELARIRSFATNLMAYNKNKIKDPALLDEWMRGSDEPRAVGIDIADGEKLSDMVGPLLPVSAEVVKFFDKRETLATIDRISGVSSVQRGVEYKTNTTNRAIESYESQMQSRADDKMDSMEEAIGRVLWMVAQMCLQFMNEADVNALLGDSQGWRQIDPREIPITFSPRVLGGSSLKPTARAKKEQALQMSQVLGQFARGTPAAVLVALRVLERAFDNELTIESSDWEMLMQSIQSAIQGQQMQAQAQAQGGSGGGGGAPQGDDMMTQVASGIEQVARFLNTLPSDMKKQIGILLARETPIEQIAAMVVQKMSNPS